MKICPRCRRRERPTHPTNGHRPYCKPCANEYAREWRKKNESTWRPYKQEYARRYRANPDKKELLSRWRRNQRFRIRYGLTIIEVEAMIFAQDGKCPVCGNEMERPHVDHCHTNGHVRGILCDMCNKGLGCFSDDPKRLEAAAAYLRQHS